MTPKTILIVDDDEDIRSVIRMRLAQFAYRLIEADNGHDAWRLIQTHRPDVMLLDWHIPNVPGEHILKTVRMDKTLDSTKVIVITGEDQGAKDALQHGAFGSLIKPFRPGELVQKIEAALASGNR